MSFMVSCPKCSKEFPEVAQELEKINSLRIALASAQAEIERLSKKSHIVTSEEGTSYCMECERWARKAERYREAAMLAIEVAQDAVSQQAYSDGERSYFDEKWSWQENIDKAKAALGEKAGMIVNQPHIDSIKYNGMCKHIIPFGQPCQECNR